MYDAIGSSESGGAITGNSWGQKKDFFLLHGNNAGFSFLTVGADNSYTHEETEQEGDIKKPLEYEQQGNLPTEIDPERNPDFHGNRTGLPESIGALSHEHDHRAQTSNEQQRPIDESGDIGNSSSSSSIENTIVAGVLICFIIILILNLVCLIYKPLALWFRHRHGRLFVENQTLVERRYKTIDRWLIQKTVQPHDDTCNNIQNYARLENEKSSLGRCTGANDMTNCSLSPNANTSKSMMSYPLLCLASSFDTNSTHDCNSSGSTTSLASSNDINGIHNLTKKVDNLYDGESHASKNLDIENGNVVDKKIYRKDFANLNQSYDKASQTIDNEIGRYEEKQCSITEEFPTRDNRLFYEDKAAEAHPVFLSRDQVIKKIEIEKLKPKHEKDPRIFERSEDESEMKIDCPSDEENSEDDLESDPKQECSICMERFKIGDKVSFSPAEGCYHVFHHGCLREWLLRKTSCPCCRKIMLPVDQQKRKSNNNESTAQELTVAPHPAANRRRNRRTRQELPKLNPLQLQSKNSNALRERRNKKCGIYSCVACGVVILETDLREDLCTKITSSTISLHNP